MLVAFLLAHTVDDEDTNSLGFLFGLDGGRIPLAVPFASILGLGGR